MKNIYNENLEMTVKVADSISDFLSLSYEEKGLCIETICDEESQNFTFTHDVRDFNDNKFRPWYDASLLEDLGYHSGDTQFDLSKAVDNFEIKPLTDNELLKEFVRVKKSFYALTLDEFSIVNQHKKYNLVYIETYSIFDVYATNDEDTLLFTINVKLGTDFKSIDEIFDYDQPDDVGYYNVWNDDELKSMATSQEDYFKSRSTYSKGDCYYYTNLDK